MSSHQAHEAGDVGGIILHPIRVGRLISLWRTNRHWIQEEYRRTTVAAYGMKLSQIDNRLEPLVSVLDFDEARHTGNVAEPRYRQVSLTARVCGEQPQEENPMPNPGLYIDITDPPDSPTNL